MENWRIFSADFFVRSEFLSTFAVPKRSSASLAQLVEHDTLNVGVQGSSPWGSTNFGTDSVAQLVEHNTFNVGVLGSSPSGITQKSLSSERQHFCCLSFFIHSLYIQHVANQRFCCEGNLFVISVS